MKTIKILLLFTFLGLNILAAQNPVEWTLYTQKTATNTIELYYEAIIGSGWKLYAQDNGNEGPVSLDFTLETSQNITEIKKPTATNSPIKVHDNVFGMPLEYYRGEATFKQIIAVNQNVDSALITGYLTYMVCNHNICLPPKDFYYTFCFANRPTKTHNGQPIKSIRVGHCTSLPSQE